MQARRKEGGAFKNQVARTDTQNAAILRELRRGKDRTQIAKILGVSREVVRYHRHIMGHDPHSWKLEMQKGTLRREIIARLKTERGLR